METLKLKMDVMTSQHGDDWIPTPNQDSMIVMHPETQWSKNTYDECAPDEYTSWAPLQRIDSLRFVALKTALSSYMVKYS